MAYTKFSEYNSFITKIFRQRATSYVAEFAEAFGTEYAIDFLVMEAKTELLESSGLHMGPNAAVFYTEKPSESVPEKFRILFTESLVTEIIRIFEIILESDKTLPQIGQSPALKKFNRTSYAKCLIAITLEFVFYHEFCHICFGHLHRLYTERGLRSLHAVRVANPQQADQLSQAIKLYELDADVSAVSFMINQFKNRRLSLYSDNDQLDSTTGFFYSLGLALTIFFRMIESWRRDSDPVYSARYADHPHPDVRDSVITAHIRVNASEKKAKNVALHKAYDQGREEAINIIADLDYFIPTFEITTDMGHAEAIKELNWLPDQLNRLRQEGVGDFDLRVMHRKRKEKQ